MDRLDLGNVETISKEPSNQLSRSKLCRGDVVFPCVGSIGKAAVINENEKYHINQNIAKITPNDTLSSQFLTNVLLSDTTKCSTW